MKQRHLGCLLALGVLHSVGATTFDWQAFEQAVVAYHATPSAVTADAIRAALPSEHVSYDHSPAEQCARRALDQLLPTLFVSIRNRDRIATALGFDFLLVTDGGLDRKNQPRRAWERPSSVFDRGLYESLVQAVLSSTCGWGNSGGDEGAGCGSDTARAWNGGCRELVLERSGIEIENLVGRRARARVLYLEMVQNPSDHLGLGDEGDHAQVASAGTDERVSLVNPPYQISPTFSEGGTMFGSHLGLIGCCIVMICRSRFQWQTALFSQSTGSRGIGPKVMDIMFSWLWDLGEDASDELEDIEALSVRMVEQAQLGIVVRGLGLVEEGGCALGPMNA
jgi:hypothetical protein